MKRSTLLPSILTAVILGAGFVVLWAVLTVWIYSAAEPMIGEPSSYVRYDATILTDGSVTIKSATSRSYVPIEEPVSDQIDGPFRIAADGNLEEAKAFYPLEMYRIPSIISDPPPRRSKWTSRIRSFAGNPIKPTIWYFVRDSEPDGLGYFVAYDWQTNQKINYIGKNGFQDEKPSKDERFPCDWKLGHALASEMEEGIPSSGPVYWYGLERRPERYAVYFFAKDQIYHCDLLRGDVTEIGRVDDINSISIVYSPSQNPRLGFESSSNFELVVRTKDKIVRLDPDSGRRIAELSLPPSLEKRELAYYLLENEGVLLFCGTYSNCFQFVWYDAEGNLKQEERVEYPAFEEKNSGVLEFAGVCGAVPSPALAASGAILINSYDMLKQNEAATWGEAISMSYAVAWPGLLGLLTLGGVLAWLCIQRQRRYHQKYVWSWAVFVFLFGLPAYMGYLLHRRWPVLEACPACGADVPRDREQCGACETAFPAPELKGTEVFA